MPLSGDPTQVATSQPTVAALQNIPIAEFKDGEIGYVLASDTYYKISFTSGAVVDGVNVLGAGGSPAGSAARWLKLNISTSPATDTDIEDWPTFGPGVVLHDLVYASAADTASQADATSAATAPAIGMVIELVGVGGVTQKDGEVTGFVGLTPTATYYLAAGVPGGITAVAPSTPGQIVQKIGFAKNATTLMLMIDRDFVQL